MQHSECKNDLVKMFTKYFIVVVCVLFAQALLVQSSCVSMTFCKINMSLSMGKYSLFLAHKYTQHNTENKRIEKVITNSIESFNNDVAAGPTACSQHKALDDVGKYSDACLERCDPVEGINPPEQAEEMDEFPQDYITNNNATTRAYYCKYLVPYLNEMCEFMDERLNAVRDCDVAVQFDDIYRKPWEKCVEINH